MMLSCLPVDGRWSMSRCSSSGGVSIDVTWLRESRLVADLALHYSANLIAMDPKHTIDGKMKREARVNQQFPHHTVLSLTTVSKPIFQTSYSPRKDLKLD